MGERGSRSPLRTELIGWAATLAFVAFSYALRRLLNRPSGRGTDREAEAGGEPR